MTIKTKKILLISFSTAIVLIGALVSHIYVSTETVQNDLRVRQMSRIDFKEPIDSLEAQTIKNTVNSLPGVENSFFNIKDGIFVYGFEPAKQTDENVMNKIMSIRKFKAERYLPSAENLASGCPVVGDKKSFTYRSYVYFSNLF